MKSEVKVKISDIGQSGYVLHDTLNAEYLGLTREDPLYFIGPLVIDATLQKVEDTILADVRTAGRFASFCYRTSVPVERDWSIQFSLDYKVDKNDQYIDLADDIRQEVVLGIPLRVLSDEEMKKSPPEGPGPQEEPDDAPRLGGDPPSDSYRPFENI